MHHAVFSGSKFHERAHFGEDSHHDADKHIADFGIVRDRFYDTLRALRRRHVAVACDAHRAVFFDIDLRTRLLDDLIDHFALFAYHVADLFGIDLERNDLRRVIGEMIVDFGDTFEHLAENKSSAFLRLSDRVKHDLFGNAFDLDIHLNRSNTLFRTRNLEIHIAEEIFKPLNIRHNDVFTRFGIFDKPHGTTRDGSLDGNARIHQSHRGTAHGSHRGRTVRRKNIGHHADRVREFFFRGDYGNESAFRKRAVTDFAATGAAQRLRFARAIAGEVVLMHIAFFFFLVETFHSLRFVEHAERAGGESLRLTSRKHSRAVHAGKNAVFAPDGTYFFEFSAVGTNAVFKDLLSYDRFRDIVDGIFDFSLFIGIDVGEVLEDFFFRFRLTIFSFFTNVSSAQTSLS